jgi:hypothetical protein
MKDENVSVWISHSDQCPYIKIQALHNNNPSEIHNQLQEVCWDYTLDHITISHWASHFRAGCVSVADSPRSGRPSPATNDTSVVIVISLLEKDLSYDVRKLHMKQTFEQPTFSEFWLEYNRKEKSLPSGFHSCWEKTRIQNWKNSCWNIVSLKRNTSEFDTCYQWSWTTTDATVL